VCIGAYSRVKPKGETWVSPASANMSRYNRSHNSPLSLLPFRRSPLNRGLPDTGLVYTYPAFPKLRPELFGNVRKPRRLFKLPEQQRTAGSK